MTIVENERPRLADERLPEGRSVVPVAAGLALCLLLAVVQVAWAGYQLGVGNQGIQIAFLKHWADPALFANDEMVRQTLPLYPSYFFRLLAPLLHVVRLEPLYFTLHVITTFLTLAMVYLLGRAIFRSHASALAGVAILLAGHHRALAGDTLYSTGFTHTYVALPCAIGALALAYRRQMVWAFAVAGLLFDLHALTGAYVLLMLAAALFADRRERPFRAWLAEVMRCGVVAVVLALPTLWQMAGQHQVFDAAWINLMRVRSAEHSFPSTWWTTGNPDLPRFALLLALFVLSWSFGAVRRRDASRTMRVTRWMTLAVLTLFVAGYLFSDLKPLPVIIRLQPFRASRILLVLMFVYMGHAAVAAIRAGWSGAAVTGLGQSVTLRAAVRGAELVGGMLILLTLVVPSMLPLLPLTVLIVTGAALLTGRLYWGQAILAVAALCIAVLAYRQIQFPLPPLSSDVSWLPASSAFDRLAIAAIVTAVLLALFIGMSRRTLARNLSLAATYAAAVSFLFLLFAQQSRIRPTVAATLQPVAQWAKANTPTDAIFLTPTGLSGFRILSDRGLVGDWRDGTQLYFSGNFATNWFARVNDLEPDLTLSPDNARLVSRGKSLGTLDTDALVALAAKYKADYLLLPSVPASQQRPLSVAFMDPNFTAYSLKPATTAAATGIAPGIAPVPRGVLHPADWLAAQTFMRTTVAQNIDRYRKADITVQILDPAGHPVQDLPAVINQTRHAFNFGVSLGFFEANDIDSQGDEKGDPVTPQELALMPTCFNASMIPFSGKWMYVEPVAGQRNYSDLDKYIGFCADHQITVEYHFLAGLPPEWMRNNETEQVKRFPDHAMSLVDRYHDRVKFWQLTNEGHILRALPPVAKTIRQKYPDLKLGVSDCVKFWSPDDNPVAKRMTMYPGVQMIPWLKSQGVTLDYFGVHGHRPYGLWADPRTMYEVFDTISKMVPKVHVTEMLLPLGDSIIGPLRRGIWTPALEADFLQDYLTVCFSHPAVELVNFWGLAHEGWGESAGLLDDHLKPRPAFDRMKHLINDVWHTRIEEPLPLDGSLATRAFHGDYDLTLTLPNGKTVTSKFTVPESEKAAFHFVFDAEKQTLTRVP